MKTTGLIDNRKHIDVSKIQRFKKGTVIDLWSRSQYEIIKVSYSKWIPFTWKTYFASCWDVPKVYEKLRKKIKEQELIKFYRKHGYNQISDVAEQMI